MKTKVKRKYPKNKQELKTAAVEAWQSSNRIPVAGDVLSDFKFSIYVAISSKCILKVNNKVIISIFMACKLVTHTRATLKFRCSVIPSNVLMFGS